MKLRSQKDTNSKKEKKTKHRRKAYEYLFTAKQRQVSYCKRKRGLMRKVIQLCKLTNCQCYLILVEKENIIELTPKKQYLKISYLNTIKRVKRMRYDRYVYILYRYIIYQP